MGALNKKIMAEGLCDELGLSKSEAQSLVDAFFDEIKHALIAGEPVKLSGFGNFKLLNKAARPGRNPKTGQSVRITARRVVIFKAGLAFKRSFKSQ